MRRLFSRIVRPEAVMRQTQAGTRRRSTRVMWSWCSTGDALDAADVMVQNRRMDFSVPVCLKNTFVKLQEHQVSLQRSSRARETLISALRHFCYPT